MQEKSTPFSISFYKLIMLSVFVICFNLFSNNAYSQFCADEFIYWFEDFGTGTTPSSHPDVLPSGLTYQPTGILQDEGIYRVINNTHQKPEWHDAPDHTPSDVNGKMLVVNGQSEKFFVHVTNRPQGFPAGYYSASLFLLNVNTPGTCAPNPLLPIIHFKVDFQDVNGNWIQLINSPVSSGAVPQTALPEWNQLGGVFTLPSTGTFTVTKIRMTLRDGEAGGCGNDFAVDDIKLASCPSGGPVPVTFINISAIQQGSGANVNWATSSELNNNYYQVERSIDAGINWEIIANVKGSAYSNVTKNYTIYDPKPVSGPNFYRIKQVDLDGRFKYSTTVNLKLNTAMTGVTVLLNPFITSITIDFLSNHSQAVSCRLVDVSGKIILSQKIDLIQGNNRKELTGLDKLSHGLYILQITDDTGNNIYNNKLVK